MKEYCYVEKIVYARIELLEHEINLLTIEQAKLYLSHVTGNLFDRSKYETNDTRLSDLKTELMEAENLLC